MSLGRRLPCTVAAAVLLVGSMVLPLIGSGAVQYEGGAAALAVLAGAHLLIVIPAGRLVDFGKATA